jgi:phospholipid-translocating ATPase
MHNKSVIALGSIVLSLGAVFLWNLILGAVYPNDKLYHVRHMFFVGFGRNPLWWLTIIIIVLSVAVFEFGVASLRSSYFPTDADIFQELEQDIEIRKRFEEASAMELQQGWNRGGKRGSFEVERAKREQAQRNGDEDVGDILRRRGVS